MSLETSSVEFWLSQVEEHLKRKRYSPQAVQRSTVVVRDFLTYLNKQRIAVESVEPADLTLYLRDALRLYQRRQGRTPKSLHAPRSSQWWRYSHTASINMLLRLVRGQWPPSLPPGFHRDICEEYDKWMDDLRGLLLETRSGRCAEARRFLSWLGERGSRKNLLNIRIKDVDAYTMLRAKSQRRTTLKRCVTDLRSFLRYLHTTGRVSLDLSTAVITPRLYAFESIPSALQPEDIKAVLETTRKDRSRKGLRDYAMLMLLASFGCVRACPSGE